MELVDTKRLCEWNVGERNIRYGQIRVMNMLNLSDKEGDIGGFLNGVLYFPTTGTKEAIDELIDALILLKLERDNI